MPPVTAAPAVRAPHHETLPSLWELVWRAGLRVSIDTWRAFRASPLELTVIAAALLLAEFVYVGFSSLALQMAVDRTHEGIYEQGRAFGVIVGSVLFVLALAIVGVAARTAFARRYYGAQAARRPGPQRYWSLFLVELRVSLAIPIACVAGALPGLMMVLVAVVNGSPDLLPLGAAAATAGAAGALACVLPGVVFATRMVVLSGCAPLTALAKNWAWGKGRRPALVTLLLLSYAMEGISLAALRISVLLAVVTIPLARAFRDTLITQVYLDFVESDEQLCPPKNR